MSAGQTELYLLHGQHEDLIIALKACEHLGDIKDNVGVLVALIGVQALPVVPEQISTG